MRVVVDYPTIITVEGSRDIIITLTLLIENNVQDLNRAQPRHVDGILNN